MVGHSAGEILIVSGPPGAGKSTIARALATLWHSLAVHLHGDDFLHFIKQGWVAPYLPEARAQNPVVIDAIFAAADAYARGGYFVVVDYVVGPWYLERVRAVISRPLHYVVLRPDLPTTLVRAKGRADDELKEEVPIRRLHDQFSALGTLERHAMDTTMYSAVETLNAVREVFVAGLLRLPDIDEKGGV